MQKKKIMIHARTKSARAQVIGLLLFLVVGKVYDGLRIGGEKMRLNEVDRARSLFFFSSRRRHTRCLSDWSSDVCSSDLIGNRSSPRVPPRRPTGPELQS